MIYTQVRFACGRNGVLFSEEEFECEGLELLKSFKLEEVEHALECVGFVEGKLESK